ncbi:hypothetical protein CFOL_v3_16644 [Cephalotus follicularis]|uniref:Mitochondrial protein n=1 Tax=Cephalotus follicularis TaxID=3775 RepID=A0A1Q3BYW6_CEPFO|nr:hypothetical protein CFOL_v3_16644 [Cephalotus follicularis]
MSIKPSQSSYCTTEQVDAPQYRSIMGALQYPTITHPCLSFAINEVCQYMHCPTGLHFQMMKRILSYINGSRDTSNLTIRLQSSLNLYAFLDSNWARCRDTQRSTTRFCTFLGYNLISWSAKKQPTIAGSSIKTEYRAMTSTTPELTWLSFILHNIGVSQPHPSLLFCDNISALYMTVNHVFHARYRTGLSLCERKSSYWFYCYQICSFKWSTSIYIYEAFTS